MKRRILCLVAACAGLAAGSLPAQPRLPERAEESRYVPPGGNDARLLAFISDLHLGLGRQADGRWHPWEDFRWPRALAGFLDELSRRGSERVDLVIVGDFLELWQAPPHVGCEGRSADLGCTLEEMEEITRTVVTAHPDALGALRQFSQKGENRLHVIPGNHDSTLLYERVWRLVANALGAESGRVALVRSGVWTSADGRTVAEHGHQIGSDVNRYENWPDIVKRVDGIDYVVRPWGERFVQRLFNAEETQYPIIDNLSPEAAGARYRMADRGLWRTAGDIARFLAFNLFETSLSQGRDFLGSGGAEGGEWSINAGRRLGADLFVNALDPGDPFRMQLLSDTADARSLRAELAALAADPDRLPDEEVKMLCDQIAVRKKRSAGAGTEIGLCTDGSLGSLAERALHSRARVMQRHIQGRQAQFPRMRVFIYGHTHQYERPWTVSPNGLVTVSVANTGAFQRVVDEAGFLRRLAGRTPQEGLRTMTPDDLPACYTAVLVAPDAAGRPAPTLVAWHMEENGAGTVTDPGDAVCR